MRHAVILEKSGFQKTLEPAYLVGMTGFEPATSASRTQRATNCATSREMTLNIIIVLILNFVKDFLNFLPNFPLTYSQSVFMIILLGSDRNEFY